MEGEAFPVSLYVESLVLLLGSVKYEDNNYTRSERQTSLQRTYAGAAQHFFQELHQGELDVSLRFFEPVLASIVTYVVYCYPQIPADVKADLAIFFTYAAILDDDTSEESQPCMETFFEDLIHEAAKAELISDAVVFQGCWIERHNFQGFPGSHDFPLFLRDLNALGHGVTGALFPARQYDEQTLFTEIVAAIPSMNNIVMFINDLMSFYKEFDEPRDQVSLVKNYCVVKGISLDQALEKLAHDAVRSCKQLFAVFEGRNPQVKAAVNAWLQGYITWHLCDHRYRLKEVVERTEGSHPGLAFRKYYEQARLVAGFNLEEWAVPSISELAKRGNSFSS
ncbi:MAG: hypothetical protein Q9195_005523 [Heterodermia aff. obscurata]